MIRRGEVLALVQAGGQGSRMDVLTRERAKPVLPYGGTHRLIDFVLSSLTNSGLVDVWVSVEYQVASIDDYLSGGRPWSLDRNRGGFRRMVPQSGSGPATEDEFAHGNADLLLRMSRDLMHFGAETLVVASADHVFAADLAPVIERHVDSGADATVMTSEVTKREASENVVVLTGRNGNATGVEVKPSRPELGRRRQRDLRLPDVVVARGALRAAARAERRGGQGLQRRRRRRRQRAGRLRRAPSAAADLGRHGPHRAAGRLLARPRPSGRVPQRTPRPGRRQGRRLRSRRLPDHQPLGRPPDRTAALRLPRRGQPGLSRRRRVGRGDPLGARPRCRGREGRPRRGLRDLRRLPGRGRCAGDHHGRRRADDVRPRQRRRRAAHEPRRPRRRGHPRRPRHHRRPEPARRPRSAAGARHHV